MPPSPSSRPGKVDTARALEVALRVARAAGRAALARFRDPGLRISTKPDDSPVSEADEAADAVVRRMLRRAFPTHAIVTEENEPVAGDGRHAWIVDPVDGTMSFVRGMTSWCVLVALEIDGVVEVGVMHAPALRCTRWARRGHGAFENGRRIRVSRRDWADAWVLHGQMARFASVGRARGLRAIGDRCHVLSGGFSTLVYAGVACGDVEGFVETGSEVWDRAAPSVIIREAGGRFANLHGEETHRGPGVICSNGLLQRGLVAALRRRKR